MRSIYSWMPSVRQDGNKMASDVGTMAHTPSQIVCNACIRAETPSSSLHATPLVLNPFWFWNRLSEPGNRTCLLLGGSTSTGSRLTADDPPYDKQLVKHINLLLAPDSRMHLQNMAQGSTRTLCECAFHAGAAAKHELQTCSCRACDEP